MNCPIESTSSLYKKNVFLGETWCSWTTWVVIMPSRTTYAHIGDQINHYIWMTSFCIMCVIAFNLFIFDTKYLVFCKFYFWNSHHCWTSRVQPLYPFKSIWWVWFGSGWSLWETILQNTSTLAAGIRCVFATSCVAQHGALTESRSFILRSRKDSCIGEERQERWPVFKWGPPPTNPTHPPHHHYPLTPPVVSRNSQPHSCKIHSCHRFNL